MLRGGSTGYITMTLNATTMCAVDKSKPPVDMVLLSVADLAGDRVVLMYGAQDILFLASNLAMGPVTNPRSEARLEHDFGVTKKVRGTLNYVCFLCTRVYFFYTCVMEEILLTKVFLTL